MSETLNPAVARQWAKYEELDAEAHVLWQKVDKELRKLAKLSKIGRKKLIVVPISESRGVEVKNQFKGEEKVFAPAFARKFKVREVPLSE